MRKSRKQHFPVLAIEYYQRPFIVLHQELQRLGYRVGIPHAKHSQFWQLVPPGEYRPLAARQLVGQYLRSVEQELATIMRRQSLAYWLHLYRRLAPDSIGADKQPATIWLVRAAFEAAIQKHALLQPCTRVGIVGQVSIKDVLAGLLMHPEFDMEREALSSQAQLVLTDFAVPQLVESYDTEKLAYEVWRCSALQRIIGKGASIEVHAAESCVDDLRSPELGRLVTVFDERSSKHGFGSVSSTGVVYDELPGDMGQGTVLLPTYNVAGISTADLAPLFSEIFHVEFPLAVRLNFIWLPFNLRSFRDAHLPFASAFAQSRLVELDAVLLLIAALCKRAQHLWTRDLALLLGYWQKAYEGPYVLEDFVESEILPLVPAAARTLGLDEDAAHQIDITSAIRFLELSEEKQAFIDVAYSGPHFVFLPFGSDRVFIDYAWIFRRLYDLFVGVRIPDQNFKGDALERLVRLGESVLPTGACRSHSGERRQIDAAFVAGRRLVIVECRAVGKSIGFARGQPEAIRYRAEVIEKALDDIDDKASWLANNPVGANYDIRHYDDILPIAVTPFVEFIPSLSNRYWLRDGLPRALTPKELRTALGSGALAGTCWNSVTVHRETDTRRE